jgi:hypothetical protein
MSKYLTTRLPRSKDAFATTPAPRLASFFLRESHDDPTLAIQLARRLVVGKKAQQAVIAAIATALLRPSASAN